MNGWTFLDAPPAQFRNEFRERPECAPEEAEAGHPGDPTWQEVSDALWEAFRDMPEGRRRLGLALAQLAEQRGSL